MTTWTRPFPLVTSLGRVATAPNYDSSSQLALMVWRMSRGRDNPRASARSVSRTRGSLLMVVGVVVLTARLPLL
jgi:hypothetical protein